MENNKLYQLNCVHCGEFIKLSIPSNNTDTTSQNCVVYSDENLGNISLSNSYKSSGSLGGYESIDIEMICPHCSYTFKSTCRNNYSI